MASPIQSHQGILDGNLKQEEEESFPYAMQLVNSCALPMALQSTIELGVFDILAKAGPGAKLSPSQIVAQMPSKNPEATVILDRILRMLASYSVLGCSVVADEFGSYQRLYSLSPVSKHFVRNEDGVSLGPLMALLQDKVFLDSWPQLKDAILEGGIPFNRVYGMHAFEYPSVDPRFNQVFNAAMLNHTTIVIKQTLESYKGFEQLKQLIDVGGGLGVTLNLITSRYPHIKGINFDMPHVIQHAPPYPGVEHLGGDMFESIPKGENIFMKWILHDWSDEHCLKLLKNCYNAIPHDGKVIVMDAVLPIAPDISSSTRCTSQMDVLMMTQNPGGKERTRQEFTALATKAGFSGIKSQLKNAILEGGLPFNKVHGMHAYEHAGRDGRFSQVFNTAMFSHTAIVVKKILDSYKVFENLKQVVDVGGGIGVALNLITSKYPNIKGINFDLPHVIKHAPPFPGVKHVAGDMFESVPKGDAIFLNGILRDWSDDHCLKLLKNCYNSSPKDGKVIVVEQILPIFPEMTTSARGKSLLDMLMMTQKPGGKVRMQQELFDLAFGAGFKTISLACFVCNSAVMEFNKQDKESV